MAQLSDRLSINVPGPWYNDSSCIDCGLCPEMAPQFFRRDDTLGQSYVWHQPSNENELTLARETQLACPTDSIGNNAA